MKDIKVYFGTTKNDEKAIRALTGANLNDEVEYIGPMGDMETPVLEYKDGKYCFLKGIELFIAKNKK